MAEAPTSRRAARQPRAADAGPGNGAGTLRREQAAGAERRLHGRLLFLADASEALAESLDHDQGLKSLARLAVPVLGDYCAVDLLEAGGRLRRVALNHPDAAWVKLAWEIQRRYPVSIDDAHGSGRVIRTAEPELRAEIDDSDYRAFARDDEHLALLRRFGFRSYICVPLTARGRVLGALTLCQIASRRRYGADDLSFALDVARRAAIAVDNARLYQEARRAENEKDESLALLDALLETAPVGMAFWDRDSRFVRVNDALAEMHGLEPEAHVGRTLAEVLPDLARQVEPDLQRVLVSGTPIMNRELSAELPAGSGKRRHLLASYYPVRMGSGETLGIGSVVADISDRKRAEGERERLFRQLQAERARFEAVLRQMPAGVVIAEAPSGRLLLANVQAERILRHPVRPSGGRPDVTWQGYRADGSPYPPEEWPLARSLRHGELVIAEELDYRFGDGSQGAIRVSSAPIRDRSGQIVAAVLTFYDVTARKRADQERARLLQAEQAARAAAETAQRRLAFLAETSLAVNSALSLPERLQIITEQARDIIGAHQAFIICTAADEATETLTSASFSSRYAVWRERFRATAPVGIERLVTDSNRARRLTEAELAAQPAPGAEEEDEQRPPRRGWLGAPLTSRSGKNIGLIELSDKLEGEFTEEDRIIAVQLAQMASVAIENVHLFRELSQFKSTLDTTLDGVEMFDPETLRFLYVNQGACDSAGYSRQEMLGLRASDLTPEYDEARFKVLLEPLVRQRSATHLTTTQRRKDGSVFPVEVFMQYIEPPGERGRVIAIVRDISDRVEARARLQRLAQSERALNAELKAIIRAMGEGVLVFNGEGRVIFTNPAAENILPTASVARFEQVVDRLEDPHGKAPRLGEPSVQGPVELRVQGWPERWLELSAYPVFTQGETAGEEAQGEDVIETILFLRDVTEARRIRLARDAFIGVLSHELRTPVTTIYGNSKILARGIPLAEEARHDVYADIETEAERLYRLVEDLLVLARYGEEAGREAETEPLLLQRIVPSAIKAEETRWPGARFVASIPTALPAVEGDQTYVEQVVRNLLSNAAKYGGYREPVEVVVDAHDPDEAILRVLDRGPGVSDEEADRLFELFYRAPGAASKASGAGIGLFVCRRLVEAMGGRIWARPRPGGGAEFGFALKWFNEEDL